MVSFEKRGWVSIWAGLTDEDREKDVLKELCGVDYYDVDYQENIIAPDWQLVPVQQLLLKLSYSDSFLESAVRAALKKGIEQARLVVMQLNFKYDPSRVTKKVSSDPVFLGAFKWTDLRVAKA
jgi:hypothetical protein